MKVTIDFLDPYKPIQKDGYIEISLPVVMNVAFTHLTLRIVPGEDTYTVCCPENLFIEKNDTQKRYYDIFMKWDKNWHYDMKISENHFIYKEYRNDYNPVCAVDEFVRFFILFDDFIMDNNVVGREEDFD